MPISRRVLAAAGVTAVVATLTACDSDQIGTAVTAGGDRLSVSDLQSQVTDVVELRNDAIENHELGIEPLDPGGDLSEIQQSELQNWVAVRLYEEVAQDLQIEVTEADVDELLDQLSTQYPDGDLTPFLAEQGFTEETVRSAARIQLINERVVEAAGDEAQAQEAVNAAMERLDIEVNPRYGSWTENGLTPGSGSVSTSAEDTAG